MSAIVENTGEYVRHCLTGREYKWSTSIFYVMCISSGIPPPPFNSARRNAILIVIRKLYESKLYVHEIY